MRYFLMPIIILTLVILALRMKKIEAVVDRNTEEVCASLAPIRKEEYKNTDWKDFDFYKSCIDNIRCTSPEKPCK